MLSKLYYLVADKEMKKRAKTLAMKKIKQAIEVCMNMNLLLEYEEIDNLQGDIKYIFHINDKFFKNYKKNAKRQNKKLLSYDTVSDEHRIFDKL